MSLSIFWAPKKYLVFHHLGSSQLPVRQAQNGKWWEKKKKHIMSHHFPLSLYGKNIHNHIYIIIYIYIWIIYGIRKIYIYIVLLCSIPIFAHCSQLFSFYFHMSHGQNALKMEDWPGKWKKRALGLSHHTDLFGEVKTRKSVVTIGC